MKNSTLESIIKVNTEKCTSSIDYALVTRPAHLNVILYDRQLLLRYSLVSVLRDLCDKVQITETATLNDTLAACFSGSDVDLILLDRFMPDMQDMSGLQWLHKRAPDTPIVILAPCESSDDARRSLAAGASGYISTVSSPAVLWSALHLVLSGGLYLPPFILDPPNAETTAQFNAVNTPTNIVSGAASVVVHDIQGNITDWCIGAEEMFGYSRNEVLGNHIRCLYDKNDPNWTGVDFDAWTNTNRLHIPRAIFVRRDGTHGLCEVRASAVLDSIGEPLAFMVANRDLSHFSGVEAVVRRDDESVVAATVIKEPKPVDTAGVLARPLAATPNIDEAGNNNLPRLTARQHDVLGLLSQGFSNRNIAKKLNIKEPTVKIHVHSILLALSVSNRTEAVVVAASKGLCRGAPDLLKQSGMSR